MTRTLDRIRKSGSDRIVARARNLCSLRSIPRWRSEQGVSDGVRWKTRINHSAVIASACWHRYREETASLRSDTLVCPDDTRDEDRVYSRTLCLRRGGECAHFVRSVSCAAGAGPGRGAVRRVQLQGSKGLCQEILQTAEAAGKSSERADDRIELPLESPVIPLRRERGTFVIYLCNLPL